MTDWKKLNKRIEESGLRKGYIYEKTGISRFRWHYLSSKNLDPTASEIQKICEVVEIKRLSDKEQIFFAKE